MVIIELIPREKKLVISLNENLLAIESFIIIDEI